MGIFIPLDAFPIERRTNLEPTAEKGIFIEYNKTSKACSVYIPTLGKAMVWRDMKFEEDKCNTGFDPMVLKLYMMYILYLNHGEELKAKALPLIDILYR